MNPYYRLEQYIQAQVESIMLWYFFYRIEAYTKPIEYDIYVLRYIALITRTISCP